MKGGAENRKKTIVAAALGAVALICAFVMYNSLFGGTTTPPPAAAVKPNPNGTNGTPMGGTTKTNSSNTSRNASTAVPGVDATLIEKTSSSLDPTLDPAAMLRTENLVYAGNGRNIFSLIYVPPVTAVAVPITKVRTNTAPPPPPSPPPPPPTCPPTCPPINLKFFGTVAHGKGTPQAFLLQGEDVYLASQGDIVARKYKIVTITATSIQVEDLSNTNTQTLPLQMN